ncbi:TerB family tellurite resistance protein [Candidatus Auribacterota bacterium]
MAQKNFIMDLARLVIASAWADGELSPEEINVLKRLLFNLENVTGEEWEKLEMYIDAPVTKEETEEILNRVISQLKSEEDKSFVLDTLEQLFEADGVVTAEEKAFLKMVHDSLANVSTGFFSNVSNAFQSILKNRVEKKNETSLREKNFGDYVKNTIFYQLKRLEQERGKQINLDEAALRKLSFAAGLLAQIAGVDLKMSKEERIAISETIATAWGIPDEQASLVAEVACDQISKGLDHVLLAQGFFDCTSLKERTDFITALFKIANSSEKTSNEEIEEIRQIAKRLKVDHSDFINAKLTIPRKDRKGL